MSDSGRASQRHRRIGYKHSDVIQASTLYDIIADLRREYPTPAASRTLDMVSTELGVTRDNLRDAIRNLNARPVPVGGRPVLDELMRRAQVGEIEDLDYGAAPAVPGDLVTEPLDDGQAGIGILLLISIVFIVGLGVAAFAVGLSAIIHSH
ncbi:MAG: hypothetical protein ACREPA_11815 [Candidatus Dormibacteraceae bacterium]